MQDTAGPPKVVNTRPARGELEHSHPVGFGLNQSPLGNRPSAFTAAVILKPGAMARGAVGEEPVALLNGGNAQR